MQFSQLKTEMISLADDPAITSSQAGTWINANYRLLLREYEWPFMVGNGSYTVTSGTQETAFSAFSPAISDFAKPLRVWISSSSTADKFLLSPIRYEERNIPGMTNCYYITPDNTKIGLVQTPTNSTDVVTVDYLKTTEDLSDDADTPAFISDFHWVLVWKALAMYSMQQREANDEFRAQYNEILAQMLAFYKLPQAGTVTRLDRGVGRVIRYGTSSPLTMR